MTDEEYTRKRNRLIPEASRYADARHGKTSGTQNSAHWSDNWNYCFFKKMDELAFAKGSVNFKRR